MNKILAVLILTKGCSGCILPPWGGICASVPSKIIKVSDIPRTKNGKIVEIAVKNTIEGNKI